MIAPPLYFFYRQEIPAPLLNNLLTNIKYTHNYLIIKKLLNING